MYVVMTEMNENLRYEAKVFVESLISKIKLIRVEKGVTSDELAISIGYQTEEYVKIEEGSKSLTLSDFFKVCDALNVDPRDILKSITGVS
ncbi:XRE family transcriptional regulator [Mucilaginibacter conchicola]|uniref:XRE family transcriptional regulator n=2 Tax=Mucilaginibacter conchicola TaxID=2303333 RepID=A0A372NN64_9SPHI|nr:XRE family transcriptional regulator [Mucilaginibacter conchicola]